VVRQGEQRRQQLVARHWPGQQEALQVQRSMFQQQLQLRRPLDPFRSDLESETAAQADDGLRHCVRAGIGVDTCDETAIQLHARQRQLHDGRERGVPGAEIVERNRDTMCAQSPQGVDRSRPGLKNILGQFDFDALRRQIGLSQQLLNVINEIAVEQLAGRHVDCDAGRGP
jgi:hypothetical protein